MYDEGVIRDSFFLAHRVYYKVDPTPLQTRLYESFPTFRGVSDESKNEEALRACLILSLVQTYPKGQQTGPFRCYLFISEHLQKWAIDEIGARAKDILLKLNKDRKPELARHFKTLVPGIFVGSRVLQLTHPPERWVCFGFQKDGILPGWMSSSMLDPT